MESLIKMCILRKINVIEKQNVLETGWSKSVEYGSLILKLNHSFLSYGLISGFHLEQYIHLHLIYRQLEKKKKRFRASL